MRFSFKYLSPLILLSTLALTGCTTDFTDTISKGQDAFDAVKSIDVKLSTNDVHAVIVPGYGAPVEGNAVYEAYIQDVANFVENSIALDEKPLDAVIFTGSYSSLEDVSEAESMNAYFNSVADLDTINKAGIKILKEECAIVSWQNISNSQDILTENNVEPGKLTVFGDENREDKLVAFSTYVFNEGQYLPDTASDLLTTSLSYTTIDFEGYDFGDNADTEEERNAKFAAEAAGAYDEAIGNEILQLRIDEWTEEFGYDVADNLVTKGCTEYEGFR